MNKINNVIDGTFMVLGTAFGLNNIQELLGIILLVLEIVWILTKIIIKVAKKIKDKKYSEIPDAIQEGITELEDLKGEDDNAA